MGYVHHSRHDHVFVISVVIEIVKVFLNLLSGYFPVVARERKDLVTARFYRSSFVNAHVSRFRGYYAPVHFQQRVNNDRICLDSAHEKENVRVGSIAGFTDLAFADSVISSVP